MATTKMAVASMKAARIPEAPIEQANGSDKDKFKRRVRQLSEYGDPVYDGTTGSHRVRSNVLAS